MKYVTLIVLLLALSLLGVAVIAQTADQPSDVPVLPAVYYGKIEVGNKEVNGGLKVEAFVNEEACGQESLTEDGMYLVVVRGDDVLTPGCADEGDEVKISVEGIEISSVKWSSGSFSKNDIELEPNEIKRDMSKLVGENDKEK